MKRQPKPITFGPLISENDVKTNYGFIYLLEVAGMKYIGQKSFSLGTDWKTYCSSSKEIKEMLKTNSGSFFVLELAKTRRELTYLEARYQMEYRVLEKDEYLNKNILGKFYRNVRK